MMPKGQGQEQGQAQEQGQGQCSGIYSPFTIRLSPKHQWTKGPKAVRKECTASSQ